jgi:acetyltransferase-like isoleucine patch superfamily enzyme
MVFKHIINRICILYWRFIKSPEEYARYIGVKIGENCFISTRNFGSEPYLIKIGNNVQLTSGVSLFTHGGSHAARRSIPSFDIFGKIVIEDWVYVGSNSLIMPGVTIGEGSIVAAGSVVTKSVPPHTVVGGNPARYLCSVDDYIEKNIKYNLNTKGMSSEEKKEFLTSLPEDAFINK